MPYSIGTCKWWWWSDGEGVHWSWLRIWRCECCSLSPVRPWGQHAGLSTWLQEASWSFIDRITLKTTGDAPHLDTQESGSISLWWRKVHICLYGYIVERGWEGAWGFLTWRTKGKLAIEFMILSLGSIARDCLFKWKKLPNTRIQEQSKRYYLNFTCWCFILGCFH